jgi:hypothetical protein
MFRLPSLAVLLGWLLSIHAHCDPAFGAATTREAGEAIAVAYDLTRLDSYIARVEWRVVHNESNSTQICSDAGSAIFIGGNLFLSAAHVVDQNPLTNECAAFGAVDPTIEFGDTKLHAKVRAVTQWTDNGGLYYPEGADLALLEVDARMMPLALRAPGPLSVCESDLDSNGAAARIGTQYGDFSSVTAPRANDEFARISFAARPGHSGAGIFDPQRGCLVGILSNGGVNGTNYVSNDNLRAFLSGRYPGTLRAGVFDSVRSAPSAAFATSPTLEVTPN